MDLKMNRMPDISFDKNKMQIFPNVKFENINLTAVKNLFNQSPHLSINTVFYNPYDTWRNPTSTLLHIALCNKDEELFNYLIAQKADVTINCFAGTPLHEAVRQNNFDVIKKLIALGADVNVCADGTGQPPLFWAIRKNNFEMSKYLIELGADVNAKCTRNSFLATPLQVAVFHGHESIVELLLDNNAIIDIPSEDGNTPLLFPGYCGHINMMELLVAHRADFNISREIKAVKGEQFNDWRLDCKKELEVMKKTIVGERYVTYYDVLTKTDDELYINLKYPNFEESAERVKLSKKFPLYGEMIWFKLYRIMRKIRSMEITSLELSISKL
ncbi:kinase D-interacting substrate of 220 kDa-like [Microplitis mediator]|uniref:kinase D-interacting substrate of 220 kDa-like n=1 Tax=Microplitis mediator TaxID=375433 RepID=UPI0025578534|nr:kinase D-interacting substrate of 220 kDa-like [Microplitis mediator]